VIKRITRIEELKHLFDQLLIYVLFNPSKVLIIDFNSEQDAINFMDIAKHSNLHKLIKTTLVGK
jgi:hypothetical protein